MKHSEECFIRYPNTEKLVSKTQLRLVFLTHFSVFGYLMKHSSMCLMYYIRNSPSLLEALTSPRLRQIFHLVAGKGISLGVGRGCSWPITTMFFSAQISSVESLGAFVPFLTPDIPSQNILIKMSV